MQHKEVSFIIEMLATKTGELVKVYTNKIEIINNFSSWSFEITGVHPNFIRACITELSTN